MTEYQLFFNDGAPADEEPYTDLKEAREAASYISQERGSEVNIYKNPGEGEEFVEAVVV